MTSSIISVSDFLSFVNNTKKEPVALLLRFTENSVIRTDSNENQVGAYPQGSLSNDSFLTNSNELTALNAPRSTEKPLSVTSSNISIS